MGTAPAAAVSDIRLFDQNGRSASPWLEPRGTQVWQFDPGDGIVYCGDGSAGFRSKAANVELDPLEDGGFCA
jgi:hypothetical protein